MNNQNLLLKRLLGFTFDFSCIMFCWISINFSLSQFFFSFANHTKVFPIFMFEENFIFFSTFSIFPLCFIGYFTASYYISNGSSLGKALVGIKFENGKELSLSTCFKRSFLQLVSYACFSIPNIVSFFTKDNSSMIDMLLKTTHSQINAVEDIEFIDLQNVIELPPPEESDYKDVA